MEALVMRITREKPCQRRHHRVSAPLYVSVNQQPFSQAKDWSLSGLCLDDYQGQTVKANEKVSLQVELPFQGFQISFDVNARVVRVVDDGQRLFVEFIELSERSFDLMNHFVDDLVRGKMATINDTICRIDVPVTPISTAPTPNPKEQVPLRRWPIKTILMSVFYLCLGLFVFIYIGVIFYSSYFTLEAPHSVISSRIQTINMPLDGVLKSVNYQVGLELEKGAAIFRIENITLATKILNLSGKIKNTESELYEFKEKYRIENERIKLYQIVSKTDTQILQAQLASKKQELNFADENLLRVFKLSKSDLASAKQLDEAKVRQSKLSYKLQELEVKLSQAIAMESVSARRHYNHKEFSTDLDISAIELQTLYSRLKTEKQLLLALTAKQNTQIVRAPYTGKIVNIYHSAETTVPKNEPILVFEEIGVITVTAYLNQDDVLQVGLHDLASVYVPALNQHFDAIISKIDRSSAYINYKTSRYTWKNKDAKTALVTLEVLSGQEFSDMLSAGLPAVVIFNRRSASSFISKIMSFNKSKPQPNKSTAIDKKSRAAYESI